MGELALETKRTKGSSPIGRVKMNLQEIRGVFEREYKTLVALSTETDIIENDKKTIEAEIENLGVEELEQAAKILQALSASQKQKACELLEGLCTSAIQYSFSPDHKIKVSIKETGKKSVIDVKIVNLKTEAEEDIMDQNGGGVVDIVSTALRLIALQTYEPRIDGPIILDEPTKMVSSEYIPTLAEFLRSAGNDFGRQIILITHNEYLASIADEIISFSKNSDGESEITTTERMGTQLE